MGQIRVACQTYTWEMLGDQWHGKVTDLLDWIADAGYAGIEITNNMIAEFADRPADFKAELKKHGLELAGFAYSSSSGFTDPDAWEDDIEGARDCLDFLSHFPGVCLQLGGASHPSRDDAFNKLNQAVELYNTVGYLGANAGVVIVVHPHSHHGSLLESEVEYRYLMENTHPWYVSLCPDTGHIVRGGQELLPCLETYLDRIRHVHLKDVDAEGEWIGLGQGVCDYPAMFELLESADYEGWVVAEEESEDARRDGIAAITSNRQYLRSIGY